MERAKRFELSTSTLARLHSTTELYPHFKQYWCFGAESNHRHEDFQSSALPTELPKQMATQMGLEPTTFGVTGRRSNQLSYCAMYWWAMTGSNCRHPACKAGALPTELITRECHENDSIIHQSFCQPLFEADNELLIAKGFSTPLFSEQIHSIAFVPFCQGLFLNFGRK